jgi:hypothetical protein
MRLSDNDRHIQSSTSQVRVLLDRNYPAGKTRCCAAARNLTRTFLNRFSERRFRSALRQDNFFPSLYTKSLTLRSYSRVELLRPLRTHRRSFLGRSPKAALTVYGQLAPVARD